MQEGTHDHNLGGGDTSQQMAHLKERLTSDTVTVERNVKNPTTNKYEKQTTTSFSEMGVFMCGNHGANNMPLAILSRVARVLVAFYLRADGPLDNAILREKTYKEAQPGTPAFVLQRVATMKKSFVALILERVTIQGHMIYTGHIQPPNLTGFARSVSRLEPILRERCHVTTSEFGRRMDDLRNLAFVHTLFHACLVVFGSDRSPLNPFAGLQQPAARPPADVHSEAYREWQAAKAAWEAAADTPLQWWHFLECEPYLVCSDDAYFQLCTACEQYFFWDSVTRTVATMKSTWFGSDESRWIGPPAEVAWTVPEEDEDEDEGAEAGVTAEAAARAAQEADDAPDFFGGGGFGNLGDEPGGGEGEEIDQRYALVPGDRVRCKASERNYKKILRTQVAEDLFGHMYKRREENGREPLANNLVYGALLQLENMTMTDPDTNTIYKAMRYVIDGTGEVYRVAVARVKLRNDDGMVGCLRDALHAYATPGRKLVVEPMSVVERVEVRKRSRGQMTLTKEKRRLFYPQLPKFFDVPEHAADCPAAGGAEGACVCFRSSRTVVTNPNYVSNADRESDITGELANLPDIPEYSSPFRTLDQCNEEYAFAEHMRTLGLDPTDAATRAKYHPSQMKTVDGDDEEAAPRAGRATYPENRLASLREAAERARGPVQ